MFCLSVLCVPRLLSSVHEMDCLREETVYVSEIELLLLLLKSETELLLEIRKFIRNWILENDYPICLHFGNEWEQADHQISAQSKQDWHIFVYRPDNCGVEGSGVDTGGKMFCDPLFGSPQGWFEDCRKSSWDFSLIKSRVTVSGSYNWMNKLKSSVLWWYQMVIYNVIMVRSFIIFTNSSIYLFS